MDLSNLKGPGSEKMKPTYDMKSFFLIVDLFTLLNYNIFIAVYIKDYGP